MCNLYVLTAGETIRFWMGWVGLGVQSLVGSHVLVVCRRPGWDIYNGFLGCSASISTQAWVFFSRRAGICELGFVGHRQSLGHYLASGGGVDVKKTVAYDTVGLL